MVMMELCGRAGFVPCEILFAMFMIHSISRTLIIDRRTLLRDNKSQHLACDACGTPKGQTSLMETG